MTVLYFLKPDAEGSSAFFAELPYFLTYTTNWIDGSVLGLTWSLATEEQFYLVWPPVERYFQRFAIPILFAIILLMQLVNFGLVDGWLEDLFGPKAPHLEILQTTFTPICLGVLLAHLLHGKRGYVFLQRIFGGRYQSLASVGLVLLLAGLPIKDISGWQRIAIQLTMAILLLSLILREKNILSPILNWRPIRRIGAISYGMYLFHIFLVSLALQLMKPLGLSSPVLVFILAFGGTVLVAECSFRFFEQPILKLKGRFAS